MGFHCTQPFIINLSLSWYDWNTVEKDIKSQIICPSSSNDCMNKNMTKSLNNFQILSGPWITLTDTGVSADIHFQIFNQNWWIKLKIWTHTKNYSRCPKKETVKHLDSLHTGGLFHCYRSDQSICHFRCWAYFVAFILFFMENPVSKQCRLWLDATLCGVWSRSELFACGPFSGFQVRMSWRWRWNSKQHMTWSDWVWTVCSDIYVPILIIDVS